MWRFLRRFLNGDQAERPKTAHIAPGDAGHPLFSDSEHCIVVNSRSDPSVSYNVAPNRQTCTCIDFTERRLEYEVNDPRRLCKHLVQVLKDAPPPAIQPYIEGIKECAEHRRGFERFPYRIRLEGKVSSGELFAREYDGEGGPYWATVFCQGKRYFYSPNERRWSYPGPPPDGETFAKLIHKKLASFQASGQRKERPNAITITIDVSSSVQSAVQSVKAAQERRSRLAMEKPADLAAGSIRTVEVKKKKHPYSSGKHPVFYLTGVVGEDRIEAFINSNPSAKVISFYVNGRADDFRPARSANNPIYNLSTGEIRVVFPENRFMETAIRAWLDDEYRRLMAEARGKD